MSAGSGIQIQDEVVDVFTEIKARRQYRYVIFKISDDLKQVEVDKKGNLDETFDNFLDTLDPAQPRYAIFDCEFETKEHGHRQKLCLVHWNPEQAKTKLKMVYASTKDALKKKLNGIHHEVQGGPGELVYKEIIEELQSKTK